LDATSRLGDPADVGNLATRRVRDLPTTYRGRGASASGYWADPSAFEHMPLVDTRVLKNVSRMLVGIIASLVGLLISQACFCFAREKCPSGFHSLS
jgi:hypothetical protein